MKLRPLLLLLLAMAGMVSARPTAASFPSDAEIRQLLAMRVDTQKRATGIVVGIVSPQGSRIVSYGTLSADSRQPVDGKTVYGIGSISKVLTALLLSEMAQHREVALEEPVADLFPAGELRMPALQGKPITLVELATHTSGLPLRPDNLVSKDPDNKYAAYTVERLLDFLYRHQPADGVRGTYVYSNVGFDLLGEALSRRAGMPYGQLAAMRITRPLDMADTRLRPTPDMRARMAIGYDVDLKPAPAWDFGELGGAGGFYSTADDLLKLLEAILAYRQSELLPSTQAMLVARRPGGMPPSDAIALAWNIRNTGQGEIAWKNGSVGGYRSFIGYNPALRVGVVALANAQTATGADDIGLHLLDGSIEVDKSVPKIYREIQLDTKTLDNYVGTYWFAADDIVTVRRNGPHLELRFSGQGEDWLPMYPYEANDFFMKIADAQMTFERSGSGQTTGMVWHQGGKDQHGKRIDDAK